MLKYVSKLTMDILPSVAATIIGAYIVNHYIVTRPDAPAAAALSSAAPKKADVKNAAKPAEASTDVANIPEPGVRAKGISLKTIFERSATEKPQEKAQEKPQEKLQEKPADRPAETASIPVEPRRQPPAHEKTLAKAAPVQPATPVIAPVIAAPNSVAPVEAAVAPEEHRDANDLARAAIERLRGMGDAPRAQEAARVPDAPRAPDPQPRMVATAPAMTAPPVRPLPPPIMVSTPAAESLDSVPTSSIPTQPRPTSARIDDPRRPTPPADIPDARPLDLRADATDPSDPSPRQHTTVAEDMLSAAKSMFHAVLPK
jgi:hypothetical protein